MLNYSVESKSLLAKLLATENIKVEHAKASTASFNLKTRTLICPIWKDMTGEMYDLMLGHEVSHALETPEEGWHDAVCSKGTNYRHFLNVVEDARIEKKIKRRYPGIRRSFVNAYKQLLEQDFFGISKLDVNKMFFIDRLNVHCKAGVSAGMKFHNDEEKRLLKLVEDAESWEDVLDATEQIWNYSKEEQQQEIPSEIQTQQVYSSYEFDEDELPEDFEYEEQDFSPSDFDNSDSEENDDNDEVSDEQESDEGSENSDEQESDEQGAQTDDSESDEDSEETEDDDVESDEQESDSYAGHGEQDDSVEPFGDPKCSTDENFRKNEHKLLSESVKSYTYIDIPKLVSKEKIFETQESFHSYMTKFFNVERYDLNKIFNKFKEKNSQFISLLVKEFEMKKAAKAFNRSRLSDTGDIDVNKIYKYQLDDEIFRKTMIVPKGKSHGLVLLLDMSGSMRDNMSGSIEQILVLTMFCKKVNIPFSVYGFTSTYCKHNPNTDFAQKKNTLQLNDFKLIEFVSSKMKSNEFLTAVKNLCGISMLYEKNRYMPDILSLGRTPLVESVIAIQPVVKEFKKKNGLDIVNLVIVHDGDADTVNTYRPSEHELQAMSPSHTERYVLRDSEENLDFQINTDSDEYFSESVRKTVFEWFVKTTQTKIFGFFLTGTSKSSLESAIKSRYFDPKEPKKEFSNFYDKYQYYENKVAVMRKEKWLHSKTPGYESFFLMLGGKNLNIENDELVITGSVTKKTLTTAMRKLTKNRFNNRILVSKFIEGIAI